jgi:hypothetical protein
MIGVQRVRISMSISASSLKVLAAYHTRINIRVKQRNRAELLEVEVQN